MSIQENHIQTEESMSIQEKKIIVSLISSVLIFGFYSFYVFQIYRQGSFTVAEDLRFWASAILILIPISIVAHIIISILFSIANAIATQEQEPKFEDERDKLIELKATRISFYVFILGFLLAMATLVINLPPFMMFVVLAVSGLVSEIVSDLSQLYFYRKGV